MSIKDKITPGDWHSEDHNVRAGDKSFSIGMAYISEVPSHENKFAKDTEGIANAKLWAASKEMLDIIERLANVQQSGFSEDEAEGVLIALSLEAEKLLNELNK